MPDSPYLLSHTIVGTGHPVVLLHGFLESHTMWDYLHLPDNFQWILVDLPGHGLSANTPSSISIGHMASCLKMTLDTLGIVSFHLIGHSMGGYVALSFLEQFNFDGKLILLNSNPWQDDEKKQADRLRVANLVLQNKSLFIREAIPNLFVTAADFPQEIAKLKEEALAIPAEHIAACSVAMRNRKDQTKTLERYAQKISILQGELDNLCPPKKMEMYTCRLNIDCVVFANAGHMSFIEFPELVRQTIIQILERETS